jgi:hypothetical protein
MLNYQTWLEKPNVVRVLLVQIERTAGTVTEYLSTHTVTVSGSSYEGIIKNNFEINESINTDYSASISYGSIDILNGNGERDAWLTNSYIWVNKSIRVYVGELPAPGATSSLSNDFELIFDGVIADIDTRDRFTLSFKVRDKLEKLNTSVSETLLGNYFNLTDNVSTVVYNNQNKNNLRPVCFGEVFNVTPLITDPVNLEYMVNNGSTEQIIEVRDNGIPVDFTITGGVPAGSFRLTKNPAGTITCSLQGLKTVVSTTTGVVSAGYDPSAKNTILNILRSYGKTLLVNEIELSSFAGTPGSEAVGVYLSDRNNVLQLCQEIAKSCGCALSVTRLGQVRLVDLVIPTTATVTIGEGDTLLNSLSVSKRIDVIAGVKIGGSRNYTQQSNLVTAIPQDHKDIFAGNFLESVQSDATIKTNYAITSEPALESSYLIDSAEADTIATKKLNLFKAGRIVYKMNCTAKFLSLQIGNAVQLTSSRFGLNNTKGLVISTRPDWLKGTIELEVLV